MITFHWELPLHLPSLQFLYSQLKLTRSHRSMGMLSQQAIQRRLQENCKYINGIKVFHWSYSLIVRKGVSAPFSLETCTPPTPLLTPPITGKYQILWWYTGIRETENNIKPWKSVTYRNCVLSTECVLIDIIVTISTAVGTVCTFSHGKVGTKSHHIKTYRLTIS